MSPGTPADQAPRTLELRVAEEVAGEIAVELAYLRRAEQAGPRAAELWLRVGEGLSYLGAEPGPAAEAAGKQLYVQARAGEEQEGLELRVILLSPGALTRLDSGVLATLRFERAPEKGPATLEIADRRPLFAPAEANEGVLLPETLDVGGR